MNQKKIMIISPKFHPLEDGLGQYTKWFYLELKKHATVSVVTSIEHFIENDDEDYTSEFSGKVYAEMQGWKFPKLFKLGQKIKQVQPDILLFQYVPFMYSIKGGINFSIAFYIMYLRLFSGKKIHIMFHELNYPFQWNLKAIVMFFSHHLMYFVISISSHNVFCSTSYFKRRISKVLLGFKKNIHHLPVGSNVQDVFLEKDDLIDFKKQFVQKNEILLGCFGSFHPAKNYPLILKTVVKLNKIHNLNVKILFIGATKENILSHVDKDVRVELDRIIYGTGFLDNNLVGKHLAILDGFVAYFSDGVSTRRGSLIAALQQGIPILTTKGVNFDEIFENTDIIKTLNSSPNLFEKEFENEIKNGWPINIKKNFEIKSFYSQNFSWKTIVQKYLDALNY